MVISYEGGGGGEKTNSSDQKQENHFLLGKRWERGGQELNKMRPHQGMVICAKATRLF